MLNKPNKQSFTSWAVALLLSKVLHAQRLSEILPEYLRL